MSLGIRTQEAEGHLCILSRELNQGLNMTSPASIPGSQVSEKAVAWGMGRGVILNITREGKRVCLELDETELPTMAGHSQHKADSSRQLPFFILNVRE